MRNPLRQSLSPLALSPVRRAALILLCTLNALAPAQTPDTSEPVTDHVRGVVLNSVDHKPVSRVLIVSDDQRMATLSDSEGRFSFDVRRRKSSGSNPLLSGTSAQLPRIRPGAPFTNGFLYLRKPGYVSAGVPLRLSPDPNTTSEEVQLKIAPACIIQGHLSVSSGNAPAGLFVQLRSRQVQFGIELWTPAGGARVNSRGDFRFPDLAPGDYKLMTTAWSEENSHGLPSRPDRSFGYKPAFYAEALDLASTPAIHLHAGDTVEADLNVRGATFYHVSVPLPRVENGGINVSVGNQGQDSGYSLNYNFQMQALEGFLPNGAYDIRVSAYGQQPSSGRGRVEVNGRPVNGAPITLVPDGEIPVIVHQQFTGVQPEPAYTGPINPSSPRGRTGPPRSVEVFLRPYANDGPGANLKNVPNPSDDNLILSGVQEGKYRVFANPYRGYVSAVTANGVDLLRQPLVVGPGGASDPIEITLRDDSASLSGTLSLPDGQTEPDSQVVVTFIPLSTNAGATAPQSGAFQGKFSMPNLAPGQYLVLASPVPQPPINYLNETVVRRLQSHGTVVTLAPGDKQEIQVPLLSDTDAQNLGEN